MSFKEIRFCVLTHMSGLRKYLLHRCFSASKHHFSLRMDTSSRRAELRRAHLAHVKALGFKMTVDEVNVKADVHTPGLTHADFDSKSGLPIPWMMMKYVMSARYFAHHEPLDDSGRTFRDFAKMTSDRLTFMVTAMFEFKPAMFDLNVLKCPLTVRVQSGYVGNTSCNSKSTVLTMSGEELFSNTGQIVSIDPNTRRPTPIPTWWREKYANIPGNHSPLKFEKCSLPDGLTPFKVTVMRSDVDRNNHTTWSSYVMFAWDAIYYFSKHGGLPNFVEIDRKGLKRMEILFTKESFDEDVLDVYVWEQPECKDRIMVHIYKNKDLLFQTAFEYFEGFIY